jgi:hypothetical protein
LRRSRVGRVERDPPRPPMGLVGLAPLDPPYTLHAKTTLADQ